MNSKKFQVKSISSVYRFFLNRIAMVALSIGFLVSSTVYKAEAIEGGFVRSDYLPSVVALMKLESDKTPYCSGALITEYVVATAAHCVSDGSGSAFKEIWIAPSGIDLNKVSSRYRVTGVFIPTGYKDSSSTKVTDNDIAFVTVKASLGKTPLVRLATLAESKSFYGQSVVVGGYGRNRPSGPTSVSPLFVQLKIIDWVLPEFTYGNYAHVVATDTESACPGDSGGPMFKETPTGLALLGVMAGTNGCVSTTARDERLVGFLISAFNSTLQLAKDAVSAAPKSPENLKVEISEDKVTVSWQDVADNLLRSTTKYEIKDSSGNLLCVAQFVGIFNNASKCIFSVSPTTSEFLTLTPIGIQKNAPAISIDIKSAVTFAKERIALQDKNKADAEARVKAEAEAKAKAENEAKTKADQEAKARAEAEAKAKAEAEARAIAQAAAAAEVAKNKKITITCVKGKTKKKISAINPKCPKGYTKK